MIIKSIVYYDLTINNNLFTTNYYCHNTIFLLSSLIFHNQAFMLNQF